jgi:ADP-ribose pyrophosphatase
MEDGRTKVIYSTPWMTVTEHVLAGLAEPFAFVARRNFVVVICSTVRGYVLVDQWRHAANMRFWELPQGAREGDETAIDAAVRELREETGWIAVDPSVAAPELYEAADWATQNFAVVTCSAIDNAGSDLEAEERIIQSRESSREDIVHLVRTGQIKDAATLAAFAVAGCLWGGVRSE